MSKRITLFVISTSEPRTKKMTMDILHYFMQRKKTLRQMGYQLTVVGFSMNDLTNEKVIQYFADNRINSLPALVTPRQVLIGNSQIMHECEKNINIFKDEREEAKKELAEENEFSTYLASHMRDTDQEDDGLEEDTLEKNSLQAQMAKRERELVQRWEGTTGSRNRWHFGGDEESTSRGWNNEEDGKEENHAPRDSSRTDNISSRYRSETKNTNSLDDDLIARHLANSETTMV